MILTQAAAQVGQSSEFKNKNTPLATYRIVKQQKDMAGLSMTTCLFRYSKIFCKFKLV